MKLITFLLLSSLLVKSTLMGATVWQLPPPTLEDLSKVPMNLARNYLGADASTPGGAGGVSPASGVGLLVADDQAGGSDLSAESKTVVLSLSDATLINRVSFFSFTAGGTADVAYALVPGDEKQGKWQTIQRGVGFKPNSAFALDFTAADARYVRMTFNTSTAGAISAMLISGTPKVSQFQLPTPAVGIDLRQNTGSASTQQTSGAVPTVDYDFASLDANAYVLFLGGGDPTEAIRVVDQDTATACSLNPKAGENLIVVDFRRPVNYYRISIILSGPGGKLDIFSLSGLPNDIAKEGTKDPLQVTWPEDYFKNATPLTSVDLKPSENRIVLNTGPNNARFILIHWTPPPGATESLNFNELSVIGKVPASDFQDFRMPAVEFSEVSPPPPPATPPPDLPNIPPTSP
ncbi:MAG: hypothetical protein SFY80_05830 [Verrucomicrobiota bacterium]|nr:hypothetical protein [Verrucomicrobiota bacterium]